MYKRPNIVLIGRNELLQTRRGSIGYIFPCRNDCLKSWFSSI